MTTITILKDKEKSYRGFICMGHAGFARKGQDIICSAISILVIGTINSLEELAGEKLNVVTNDETGFIRCDIQGSLQEKSSFLLDSMVFSLENLSREYGVKYLQVKFEEV